MSEKSKNWSKEETMLAFELYCIIPSGKDTENNPLIKSLASAINRTPGSVKMKLQNFKSLDPSYTLEGKVGLNRTSTTDRAVCNEFLDNWDALVYETSEIKARLGISVSKEIEKEAAVPFMGFDRQITRKERVGQSFFRTSLLAAYDSKCCFTGIAVPALLRASHIKPWSESNDINEKANPRNGLLLNALHDAAFDRGYITITVDYKILVSKALMSEDNNNRKYFIPLHDKYMMLPSRFYPDKQFIQYHNKKFRG